jgi:hypothetical protein
LTEAAFVRDVDKGTAEAKIEAAIFGLVLNGTSEEFSGFGHGMPCPYWKE